ncbi:MAG: hemin transporter [Hydrogenophilales bacterium 16-62-9]|nr:MAG: hemin transporter [Hydrogenophilales bacterium 16-62-9]
MAPVAPPTAQQAEAQAQQAEAQAQQSEAQMQPTKEQAQQPGFDVFEYRVEGTTLLPATVVEQAVYPHLGEKKTLADVEKAREALEKAYHGAGYLTVLVSIPQQKVDGGLVKLAVTEAPVERLRVVDSQYSSLGAIKAASPSLAEGAVPNFNDMQKELAALNRSGDRKITPVLRPGVTPGTVEIDLKVQDQLPFHGNVDVNNYYSQDTSPTRLEASLRWDNLWQKQHGLGLTFQTAPEAPDESRVFALNYTVPLASGNYLAFYAVKSDSNVAAVGTLNVIGNGEIYGARYIVPLRGREDFFHTATLGVDYKSVDQTVALIGGGGFDTPITYMPFTLGWDGTWLGQGVLGHKHISKLGVSFNFNIRGTVDDEQEFADKRFEGRSSYAYLRGVFSHEESLANDTQLALRGGWQLASRPLVSNEQFLIGGVHTVRGYLEAAALGDDGINLSLEARTPNYARQLSESLDELRLLAFVDGGYVSIQQSLDSQEPDFTLAGTGIGLRFGGWGSVTGSLDWAVALKDLGSIERGDSQAYFRLGYAW